MTEYAIFRSCFDRLPTDAASFEALVLRDGAHIFREEGGFAVVEGDRITLLCVSPEYRGKGAGTRLLAQCEDYIKSQGHEKAVLSGSLIPGAASGSYDFFEKRGYILGGEFNEMSLELDGFNKAEELMSAADTSCVTRYCDTGIEDARNAVAKVDEDWVQYFNDTDSIYCVYANNEIASFCIVGNDETCLLSDGSTKVGSVGCVGTIPEYRRRGFGLAMVALCAEFLNKLGCGKLFIHQTHLDKWYGKLGAQVVLKYRLAEKKL